MGSKQVGFGDYEHTTVRKRTRRERFLAETEAVVPWNALTDHRAPLSQDRQQRLPPPAKGEHPFRVITQRLGFRMRQLRVGGIVKNRC